MKNNETTFHSGHNIIKARNIPHGYFAIGVSEYQGELFYSSVAGIHGLTEDRYWPNEYTAKLQGIIHYQPNFPVLLVESGESFTVKQR